LYTISNAAKTGGNSQDDLESHKIIQTENFPKFLPLSTRTINQIKIKTQLKMIIHQFKNPNSNWKMTQLYDLKI
jgi:hypothetical protein